MATVTAPQLVSTPVKTTLFLARREDLRLVKVPRYPQFGIGGQKVGEQPGQAVQFRNGRLDVPEKGPMTLDDGREADSQEVLEWLQRHPLLANVEEGFWVVDQLAPPVSVEEMKTLNRLSLSFDADGLNAMIAQEEQGWNRADLLEAVRDALAQVEQVNAEMAAERAEAEAAAKPAKSKG